LFCVLLIRFTLVVDLAGAKAKAVAVAIAAYPKLLSSVSSREIKYFLDVD